MIKNAKIVDTMLGIEDHGIFTASLELEYGDGTQQSFGRSYLGGEFGCKWIEQTLDVVGVDRWEKLKGKMIRVEIDNIVGNPLYKEIIKIGNIFEDIWFDPKELAKKMGVEN